MKPSFPKDPVMKNEGGKIIMEATVKADPKGTITWLHESQEVKAGPRFVMGATDEKDGTTIYTMTVSSPKKEDAGAYTLKVKNSFGENHAKFSLNVGPPAGSGDIAPEFVTDPKIYANADNSVITMECQVKAKPEVTAQWHQDDKEVNASDRLKMKIDTVGDNKYMVKLEIHGPQNSDGGKYKCTAKNKYGSCYAYLSLKF